MKVVGDEVSYRFSAKLASGEELDNQLKLFVDLATMSGYVITKKFITHHQGYGIVEVDAKKV
jgi:hypothetical protein